MKRLMIVFVLLILAIASIKLIADIGDYWDIGPWRVNSSGELIPGSGDGTGSIGSSSCAIDQAHIDHLIMDYTTSPSTYSWTATEAMMGKLILCDSDTGDITVTLPSAIGLEGKTFTFKVYNSTGKHTLDGAGSEVIDGATTFATMDAINDTVTILSAGVLADHTTSWFVIDHYIQ